MNYTNEVVNEILDNILKEDKQDKLAFLVGITKSLASLKLFKFGKYSLEYEIKDERLALITFDLLKELFNVELDIGFKSTEPRLYTINISGEFANNILKQMGLSHYENNEFVVEDNTKYVDNISGLLRTKGYIKGVFVCSGNIYFPKGVEEKTDYHVEFNFQEENYAISIQRLLKKAGISMTFRDRESIYSLYGKNSQIVSDVLALVQANKVVLKLADVNINRETNNQLNRENNFSAANLDKTIIASSKYIHAIEILDKYVGIDNLDEKMAMVCRARCENYDLSLSELASKVNLTKSSLNRMLNKILDKANKIQLKEGK